MDKSVLRDPQVGLERRVTPGLQDHWVSLGRLANWVQSVLPAHLETLGRPDQMVLKDRRAHQEGPDQPAPRVPPEHPEPKAVQVLMELMVHQGLWE